MKNIWMILPVMAVCALPSCTPAPGRPADDPAAKTPAVVNAKTSCPLLVADQDGAMVMSWVKENTDGSTVMCYAVSADHGKTFGAEIAIAPTRGVQAHAENLPKILFKPNGEIIAVWGIGNPNPNNKYSGLVYYTQSFDNGKSWNKAIPLVTDTASYDQRYFDLSLLPNGEAVIIWLDNRAADPGAPGSTLYCAVTDGKNGFQNEHPVGETCCPCCRTDLFVDSKGDVHAVYRDIINDSIRDMVHIVSLDGGKTFSPPKRISEDNWKIDGCPHTGPTMTENASGLHFAWFTAGGQEGVYYCTSNNNGQDFTPRKLLGTNARHPQMRTLPGGAIGIVWEETVKSDTASLSRIVLQVTTADGSQKRYDVTTGKAPVSYPVLMAGDAGTVVVAWVQADEQAAGEKSSHGKGGKVFFKTIRWEDAPAG